ncbi:hypothetical protein L3Q82_012355, partial [Scortum barcoo]
TTKRKEVRWRGLFGEEGVCGKDECHPALQFIISDHLRVAVRENAIPYSLPILLCQGQVTLGKQGQMDFTLPGTGPYEVTFNRTLNSNQFWEYCSYLSVKRGPPIRGRGCAASGTGAPRRAGPVPGRRRPPRATRPGDSGAGPYSLSTSGRTASTPPYRQLVGGPPRVVVVAVEEEEVVVVVLVVVVLHTAPGTAV